MKYLSNYIEAGQTAIFDKYGVFFAFSDRQYNERAQPGVEYVSLGSGMIVPKEHAQAVTDAVIRNGEQAVAQDIAENGKRAIIERELRNHEYGYTWDITDTLHALNGYDITAAEVQAIANSMDWSDC